MQDKTSQAGSKGPQNPQAKQPAPKHRKPDQLTEEQKLFFAIRNDLHKFFHEMIEFGDNAILLLIPEQRDKVFPRYRRKILDSGYTYLNRIKREIERYHVFSRQDHVMVTETIVMDGGKTNNKTGDSNGRNQSPGAGSGSTDPRGTDSNPQGGSSN
jgi:hypothetical protein